ncbi:MAG: YkgJ family cysteine cluster protein [Candidatus Omnitrophica bacterium]|nr:YkgJ family cysteine cluster protein [Candidatus Omnitrophota bacterium]
MTLCTDCGAKCCKYFAMQIDAPKNKNDFENIRWYLAHRDVSVYIDKRRWYLEIKNECEHLTVDHRCAIYEKRPLICQEHDAYTCEKDFDDFGHEHVFHNIDEFDRYLKKRFGGKKRKTKPKTSRKKQKRTS